MEYGKGNLYYNDFLESRLEAERITKLTAALIPGYPGDREISTIDDVHEAAIQQDILQSLAHYYLGQVDLTRDAAHETLEGLEWHDSEKAQEYYERAALISSLVPLI